MAIFSNVAKSELGSVFTWLGRGRGRGWGPEKEGGSDDQSLQPRARAARGSNWPVLAAD
jgi:hypothetical protein